MILGILLLLLYVIVMKICYKYLCKRLEKFDLYKKIHAYHKQSRDLMDVKKCVAYLTS